MFTLQDFKSMEISFLKKLCKHFCIKGYSLLRKNELQDILNKFLAIKRIQRSFRNYFYKDEIDCITLEPVSFPCFVYRTVSGKHYFYAFDSIITFIMKSGNYNDPLSREEYTDDTLQRLDNQVKYYFPKKSYVSTYKIKKNPRYAYKIRTLSNEVLTFEMRITELKTQLLFISEVYNTIRWEPISIENQNYDSVDIYINNLLRELKLILHL